MTETWGGQTLFLNTAPVDLLHTELTQTFSVHENPISLTCRKVRSAQVRDCLLFCGHTCKHCLHIRLFIFTLWGKPYYILNTWENRETLFKFSLWGIADVQCCNFRLGAKWLLYTHISLLFSFILFRDGLSGLPWWLSWERIRLQRRRPRFGAWVWEDPLEQGKASTDTYYMLLYIIIYGIHLMYGASLVAQMVKNLPTIWETGFDPWVGKILWRREMATQPVLYHYIWHILTYIYNNIYISI